MRDSGSVIAFGEYELDFERAELRRGGRPVDVQPTPLRLLLYLAEHRDRTVPRRELLGAIWPDVVVGDEALTTALAEARRAVGDGGTSQRIIRTRKGAGYRFVAAVVSDSLAGRLGSRRAMRAAGIVLGTCAALAVGWLAHPFDRAARHPVLRSLAVLPLENLSGDPRDDPFAKAMTDLLISELAQLPSVRIISRTSVESVAGGGFSLGELAQRLDVEGIVEGSIVRERTGVRMTVSLIDAGRDQHLWSASFERDSARAFEIQGEATQQIAQAIGVAVAPQLARRFNRHRVLTWEAQDALSRGLVQSARFDFESMRAAVTEFEQAARLAPAYAPAHAHLAAALVRSAVYGQPAPELLPRARHEVARAIELDDELGEAHFTGATISMLEGEWSQADAAFSRGIALGVREPIIATAYAFYLLALDSPDAAVNWMTDVAARAPFDLYVNAQRGRVLFLAGRVESALREFDRILATEHPRDAQIFALRVYAQESLGRFDEAVRDFRRFIELAGHDERRAFADELEQALRSIGARGYWAAWARVSRGNPLRAASAHAYLGDLDAAFAALDEAWQERSTARDVYFVRTAPGLAPLRADPRFLAFVQRLPQRVSPASVRVRDPVGVASARRPTPSVLTRPAR